MGQGKRKTGKNPRQPLPEPWLKFNESMKSWRAPSIWQGRCLVSLAQSPELCGVARPPLCHLPVLLRPVAAAGHRRFTGLSITSVDEGAQTQSR